MDTITLDPEEEVRKMFLMLNNSVSSLLIQNSSSIALCNNLVF